MKEINLNGIEEKIKETEHEIEELEKKIEILKQ